MLNKIIAFSLNNRLVVLTASVLLMVAGLYSTYQAEVDVFPDLNAPTVTIMTEAPGMAPEEVEQLVSFPIETAINGAPLIRRVRSTSTAGFSVVWAEFDWDADVYRARQAVSERLSMLEGSFPEGVGSPVIGPQSSIMGEVLIIGLTADSTSAMDLRSIADKRLRPRLLSAGGVAQVSVMGGEAKEYQILLDPGRMKHFGVSLNAVMEACEGMNRNESGGVIYEHGNEYIVRAMSSTAAIDEIAASAVRTEGGGSVTLADIAEVKIGAASPKLGTASVETKPAVLLTITKQPGAGTIELTERIERMLASERATLPPDVKVSTDIFRQSRFIEASIGNIRDSLLEGSVFVVIVLLIFLANWRTTIISLITLPVSLLTAMLALDYFDAGINTMTLGGLAISIGSLVDDAIVDVENAWKHLRLNAALPPGERKKIREVVYEASREVRLPILNSTFIIVASFVPLFFLSGMEGRMLIPLGTAFITALFASTLVALTLTPALCSYLLKKPGSEGSVSEARISKWLKKHYERALRSAMDHKKPVIISTITLFCVAAGLFFTLGSSFLPPFNEGSFTINISAMPGISLEESDKIGRQAEEILLGIPEIKTVARKTGRAELDEHALGANVSEIEAPFELDGRSREELAADVRQRLSQIAGANIELGQPVSHRLDAMLSGTQAGVAIKIFGDDLNAMHALGMQIKKLIGTIDGVADLSLEQRIERPELLIVPRRAMMARYGITMADFNDFAGANLSGAVVSQVYEDGISYDLVVRSGENSRSTAESMRDLMIDCPGGGKIPLSAIADVRTASGPGTINRENGQRKLVLSANASGRDIGSVAADIQRAIDENISLPEGCHIEYGGQFESSRSASRTLLAASLMSIAVIFLLLYLQFKDPAESAVVLINLPLALIGGVFALLLTGSEVSIPAIIGFISLFGIATRNGMLLISRYDALRTNNNKPLRESIIEGSLDRLNPILMTALSSALAMIPLALRGSLPGNEIQSPMAKVILGGLISSTLLNAFVIPIVYEWLNRLKRERKQANASD